MRSITELPKWKRPENYAGATYYDYSVLIGQHRDSGILDRCNFEVALDMLIQVGGKEGDPEPDAESSGDYIVARALHWAVGWVETILIHDSASDLVKETALDILNSLADYPILDEDRFSDMEIEEASEYWENMSIRERVDILGSNGLNIFAARRDDIPEELEFSELVQW